MFLKPEIGSPPTPTMILSPNRGVTSPMNHGNAEGGTGRASTSMSIAGISPPSLDPTRIGPGADRMVGSGQTRAPAESRRESRMSVLLSAQGLTKNYSHRPLFAGLSFDLRA